MESLFKRLVKAIIQGAVVGLIGSILLGVFSDFIPEQYETLIFWVFFVVVFVVIDYVMPPLRVTKIGKYFSRAKD